MLSFNDKAVSFVQSSSSSGYDIQRSLSRKRNQLSNFYDMELAMCDSCGTLLQTSSSRCRALSVAALTVGVIRTTLRVLAILITSG